jgi:hypothetical protein
MAAADHRPRAQRRAVVHLAERLPLVATEGWKPVSAVHSITAAEGEAAMWRDPATTNLDHYVVHWRAGSDCRGRCCSSSRHQ